MGYVGEMHPVFRVTCVVGALTQAPFDFFSAFLVGEYMIQVSDYNAKTGEYTSRTLLEYYWCDVVSFGLCVWISLLALHLCCIAGFIPAPYVPYQAIAGGVTDRLSVLDEERSKRLAYDLVQQERYEYLSNQSKEAYQRRKNFNKRGVEMNKQKNIDNDDDIEIRSV